jgi:signal transduction histidine kinase
MAMTSARPGSPRLLWSAVAVLVALLALLALLQVHWLRAVAAADRQRLAAAVDTATGALAGELDREVSRAWLAFQLPPQPRPPDAEQVAAMWRRWRETAPLPDLVSAVWLVREEGGGAVPVAPAGGGAPPPAPAPRVLPPADPGGGERGGRRSYPLLRPGLPGLQITIPVRGAEGGFADRSTLLVVFDRAYLAGTLLPALVERHLVPVLGPGLAARVTARGSGEVVLERGGGEGGEDGEDGAAYPWTEPLFDLLPPEELSRLAVATGMVGEAPPAPDAGDRPGARTGRWVAAMAALVEEPAAWELAARPAAGSLGAALARARLGNAALSFGILLLLACAAVALAVASRRLQRTARRQLELTAAVSHELRTPLAGIRSLADNLADGLVREPAQARLYGEEIRRQGERLTQMVEQVLALSAHEVAPGRQERRPLEVAELVRRAAREAAAAVPGAVVEVDAAEVGAAEAPAVVDADPGMLRHAVQNLVGNALKHGGSPPWARVRVAAAPAAGELRVEVADRGPGVPAAERPHLFEPFYRGRRAEERQLAGAGLGLHLVRRIAEAHGGRVEVAPAAGGGAVFTLVLPLGGGGS